MSVLFEISTTVLVTLLVRSIKTAEDASERPKFEIAETAEEVSIVVNIIVGLIDTKSNRQYHGLNT